MRTTPHLVADEMSYFRLSLLSYLLESHPDKAVDEAFIALRSDTAAEAYSDAIKSGCTHDEADELASEILYTGLYFSPYRTLVRILWDEFAEEVDPAQAEEVAMTLFPRLYDTFEKYTLSDDFDDSDEYGLLYTELTGMVQTFLEDGLQ